MSTLTRTSEMLDEMIFNGRKPTTADIAAQSGLPEKILQQTLADINRHLDYMRGFTPLASWFITTEEPSAPDGAPLEQWFVEEKLTGKYQSVICVADMQIDGGMGPLIPSEKYRYKNEYQPRQRHDGAQRIMWLRVFLTRKKEWIIWVSWPMSVFRYADNMDDMLAAVEELRPEGKPLRCFTRPGHMTDVLVPSVPLLITAALELHLARSFAKKREEASQEEATFAGIRKRTAVYSDQP